MALKNLRFVYQSKGFTTGLTDVKGQVYFNGVAKYTGTTALVATEVDSTNSPGMYELLITPTQLTAMGAVVGQSNTVEVYFNSVTKPGYAPMREEVTLSDSGDIAVLIGTPVNGTVSQDVAAVKSDTAAIKVDLESGAYSLQNIVTLLNSIKNGAGFAISVPAQLTSPATGSKTYVIPFTLYNEANNLIDPDSNIITVGVVNSAGVDRGSYLSGSSGTPATINMTRISLGQYSVTVVIPSGAVNEELIFSFAYSVGGNATVRKSTTNVITDVNADGFALQTTLVAVQSTVNSTQTTVNTIQSELTDATNGLPAIKSATTSNSTAIAALQNDVDSNILGSGFVAATDTLHQIAAAIANIGVGGRAV